MITEDDMVQMDRAEFDMLVTSVAKTFLNCAKVLDKAREVFVNSAVAIGALETFYCRKCETFFRRGEVKQASGLSISCPVCGDGLIPARNIKFKAKT